MNETTTMSRERTPLARGPLLPVTLLALIATSVQGGDGSGTGWLAPVEEAARMVRMMGGAEAVRAESASAIRNGGQEDCAWAGRLTGILLTLDPQDAAARELRAEAVLCLEGPGDPDSGETTLLAEPEAPDAAGDTRSPDTEAASIGVRAANEEDAEEAIMTHGDPWNVLQDHLSLAVADAAWTINEDFPGTKLILDGRYSIRKDQLEDRDGGCDCVLKPPKTRAYGVVRAHLQWGEGESALEYARLSVSAVSDQRDYPAQPGRFTTVRDMYEWGVLQGGKDDPLGVDHYGEFVLARFARTWARAPWSSPWWFIVGLEGSFGYSWSESSNESYESVSNPIIGTSLRASVNRSGLGSFYLQQRVINGFGFSSPARTGPVSREARFRFGYLRRFESCLVLDLFVEKRSFNFSDPQLPDIYTKSKRTGLSLGCAF